MDFLKKAKDRVLEKVGLSAGNHDEQLEQYKNRLEHLEATIAQFKKGFDTYSKAMQAQGTAAASLAQDISTFYIRPEDKRTVSTFVDIHQHVGEQATRIFKETYGWDILQSFDEWEQETKKIHAAIKSVEDARGHVETAENKVSVLKKAKEQRIVRGQPLTEKEEELLTNAEQKADKYKKAYSKMRSALDGQVTAHVDARYTTFDHMFYRLMEFQLEYYRSTVQMINPLQQYVDGYRKKSPTFETKAPAPGAPGGATATAAPQAQAQSPPQPQQHAPANGNGTKKKQKQPEPEPESEDEEVSDPEESEEDDDEEEPEPAPVKKQSSKPSSQPQQQQQQQQQQQPVDLFNFDSAPPPQPVKKQSSATSTSSSSGDLFDLFQTSATTSTSTTTTAAKPPKSTSASSPSPDLDIFSSFGPSSSSSSSASASASSVKPPSQHASQPKLPKSTSHDGGLHDFDPFAFAPKPSTRATTPQPSSARAPPSSARAPPSSTTQPNTARQSPAPGIVDISALGGVGSASLERAIEAAQQDKINEIRMREQKAAEEARAKEQALNGLEDKLKAWEFKDGQQKNIRNLLQGLHNVLWPELGWKAPSLTDLMDFNGIKKFHRKAVILLHPDKLVHCTAEQKVIGERVFDVINTSFDKFKEMQQQTGQAF